MPQRELRNNDVMTAVIERNADTVYRIAYLRTGNTHDAEDIMQEVFVRYVKANPAFESPMHEKAWFIRVTVNRTNSFFASAWKKRHVIIPNEEIPAREEDSEEYVLESVLNLPKNISTAIHLHYFEDLSVKEIAEAMDKSESAVKALLFRGRKMLKLQLEEAAD